MEIILRGLFIFGVLQALFAGVWLLVVAFRTGIGHGLLMLFVGWIYAVIFSILHWEEAKKPFLSVLIGYALIIASILLKPVLAPGHSVPDDPKVRANPAQPFDFKQKLATAIAARIRAHQQPASTGTPSAPVPIPAAGPAKTKSAPVSQGSNSPALKSPLLSLVNRIKPVTNAPAVLPTGTNDWDRARSQLRVGGVMQTGTQLFATVNQQVVKINDEIGVELNGRPYRFKVRQIDLFHKTVRFDPVEP